MNRHAMSMGSRPPKAEIVPRAASDGYVVDVRATGNEDYVQVLSGVVALRLRRDHSREQGLRHPLELDVDCQEISGSCPFKLRGKIGVVMDQSPLTIF